MVSRRWRALAQSHEKYSFVCSLEGTLDEKIDPSDEALGFNTRLIEMTRVQLPVRVRVKLAPNEPDPWSNMPILGAWSNQVDCWFESLGSLENALRAGCVVGLELDVPAFRRLAIFNTPAPNLRRLEVATTKFFGLPPLFPENVFSGVAPRLRDVSLSNVALPRSPETAVSGALHVEIGTNIVHPMLTNIAVNFPQVQSLSLMTFSRSALDALEESNDDPIVFPQSLASLSIAISSSDGGADLAHSPLASAIRRSITHPLTIVLMLTGEILGSTRLFTSFVQEMVPRDNAALEVVTFVHGTRLTIAIGHAGKVTAGKVGDSVLAMGCTSSDGMFTQVSCLAARARHIVRISLQLVLMRAFAPIISSAPSLERIDVFFSFQEYRAVLANIPVIDEITFDSDSREMYLNPRSSSVRSPITIVLKGGLDKETRNAVHMENVFLVCVAVNLGLMPKHEPVMFKWADLE